MTELEKKGFQPLTEQEAADIDGGSLASYWVGVANAITQNALGSTAIGLGQYKATSIAAFWVNFANQITSNVLSRVILGLQQYKL